MSIIVPPSAGWQHETRPTNHPDIPEQGDDEDFVEYLTRVGDLLVERPPAAPPGFVLVECTAEPRHWPEYHVAEDVFYPAPCSRCQMDSFSKSANEWRCKATHRRWKSWAILGWLGRKGYSLGAIGGCGTSYGRCEFCGIGRQHTRPRWKGSRPYILGVKRETWACLRRGHRRQEHISCGLCSVCMPCPECGSTDPTHYSCEVSA